MPWPIRVAVAGCALLGGLRVAAPPPTVDDLKQTLEAKLVSLKPATFKARTVLYDDVEAGAPSGGAYPFVVTVNIHDYSPGTPAKKDYGRTCLRRMDQWTFALKAGKDGGWIVSGRMTGADSVCMDNPAEGESSIPLESLMPASSVAGVDDAGNVPTGEWGCYDVNAKLLPKLAFVLKANGRYTDLDGARGGTYVYSGTKSEIAFRGGFLTGRIGTNFQSSGFELADGVSCEPKK